MQIKFYALSTPRTTNLANRFWLVIAPLLLMVAGCSSTPNNEQEQSKHEQRQQQVASWNNIQQKYPREQFLTAVGEGKTLEASQQQALFNLGQIFSVRVKGVQQSSNAFTSSKVDGVEKHKIDTALSTSIQRHSDQLIQGAEVYPSNVADDLYRSLAVLDKAKGRGVLASQLRELDQQIEAALVEANTFGDKRIETAGWLQRAIKLAAIRQQRHQQMQVLDGNTLPLEPNQAQLRQRLHQHIRALPFKLTFKDDIAPEKRTVITNALAVAGIGYIQEGDGYLLVIHYRQQPFFVRDKWHWITSELRMEVTYNGQPLGEIVWELKAAATLEHQLQTRMNKRLTETIADHIIDRLIALASELS